MNYEVEINKINARLDNLQQSFIQAQKNQVPITAKTDDTANKVTIITPYTESKTAYFGENYKTFYGVPSGNVSVFFNNYDGEYEISRIEDRLTVSFPERLTDMTNITVMVQ